MPGKLATIKQGLIDKGAVIPHGDCFIAAEDILLSSSTYAAALVAGTSRSGPQSWRTSDGITLKALEEQALQQNKLTLDEIKPAASSAENTPYPVSGGEAFRRALLQSAKGSPGTPYLGSIGVVDKLVREFIGDIFIRQSEVADGNLAQPEAVQADKSRAAELGMIFAGEDPNFIPISPIVGEGWNAKGLKDHALNTMGEHLSDNARLLSTSEVLTQVFACLVLEVYAAVSKFNETGDLKEAKERADCLVEDWTKLLLGIPADIDIGRS